LVEKVSLLFNQQNVILIDFFNFQNFTKIGYYQTKTYGTLPEKISPLFPRMIGGVE
jgi:hypothetical protein